MRQIHGIPVCLSVITSVIGCLQTTAQLDNHTVRSAVRIVAVEPYENQVLGGGLTGPHGIPDIGYGIVPENYNSYVVDNVSAVASRDAQRAAQQVLRTDAIPASVSAGAALHAAAQLLANCNSRAALAIFSGRASIV